MSVPRAPFPLRTSRIPALFGTQTTRKQDSRHARSLGGFDQTGELYLVRRQAGRKLYHSKVCAKSGTASIKRYSMPSKLTFLASKPRDVGFGGPPSTVSSQLGLCVALARAELRDRSLVLYAPHSAPRAERRRRRHVCTGARVPERPPALHARRSR